MNPSCSELPAPSPSCSQASSRPLSGKAPRPRRSRSWSPAPPDPESGRGGPNEPALCQALGVERQAEPVVPKALDPVAAPAPGHVQVDRGRIAPEALRSHGHGHARALRSVADRLLGVACAMLKTGSTFDPNVHHENRLLNGGVSDVDVRVDARRHAIDHHVMVAHLDDRCPALAYRGGGPAKCRCRYASSCAAIRDLGYTRRMVSFWGHGRTMLAWLKRVINSVLARMGAGRRAGQVPSSLRQRRERVVTVPIHRAKGRMPPLRWRPCHPSTVTRFKAEMSCSQGHGLVLRGHSVSADGRVMPSVVCLHPGWPIPRLRPPGGLDVRARALTDARWRQATRTSSSPASASGSSSRPRASKAYTDDTRVPFQA